MHQFITQLKLVSCAVVVAGFILESGAATISTFNFDGAAGNEASYAPATQTAGVTVGSITRGSGLTPSGNGGTFSSSGWTTAGSRDANDYYDLSISVEVGYVLNLDRLELDERRSGTGIRSWAIYSSLDSFSTALATFGVPDNTNTRTDQGVSFGSAFDALTGFLTFRIYGYDSESGSGTWRVDNIDLEGVISKAPVASPISTPDAGSSLLLLSVSVGGLTCMFRRRA